MPSPELSKGKKQSRSKTRAGLACQSLNDKVSLTYPPRSRVNPQLWFDVTLIKRTLERGAFRTNLRRFRGLDGNGQMTRECIDGRSVLQNIGPNWGASASVEIVKVEQGACNESLG